MMSNDYKVSIITVVYNGVKTIEQTILSVLGQTYNNIEYIIIDGQSTDGTQQIVEKYIGSITYYISEKDKGLYDAMNKGIQQATGEIIGIINSDDWYESDTVEHVVQFLEQNNVDVVYGNTMMVYTNGSEILSPVLPLETLWYQMVMEHPSVFVMKNVYERYGIFNLEYKLSSDYDLLLRFYSRHVRFGYIDAVLAHFRVGGISTKLSNEVIEEHRKISKQYIDAYVDRREELLIKLEEKYKLAHFFQAINREKNLISKLLYRYFHEAITEVLIFGAGIRGFNCYEMLENEQIKTVLFIDNNPSKKGQFFFDVKVVAPQEIRSLKAYILIAVRNGEEEIKRQLESMGNKNLKYVGLNDLKDLYYKENMTNEGI